MFRRDRRDKMIQDQLKENNRELETADIGGNNLRRKPHGRVIVEARGTR